MPVEIEKEHENESDEVVRRKSVREPRSRFKLYTKTGYFQELGGPPGGISFFGLPKSPTERIRRG